MIDVSTKYLPQIVFEVNIVLVFLAYDALLLKKMLEKKTRGLRFLFAFFSLYSASLIVSLLTQVHQNVVPIFAFSPDSYWSLLLENSAQVFSFVANTTFLSFYKEVFGMPSSRTRGRVWNAIFFTLTGAGLAVSLIPGLSNSSLGGGMLLVQSTLMSLPIAVEARRGFRETRSMTPGGAHGEGHYAFYAMFVDAVLFVVLWVVRLLNIVWDAVTGVLYGPFFYVAWCMILSVTISSYLGFTYPRWFREAVLDSRGEKGGAGASLRAASGLEDDA
ncbi:MAG: hypothetical protein ACTSU5_04615 [Promethearchaeota archaeon]